jgi:hypothetical protein
MAAITVSDAAAPPPPPAQHCQVPPPDSSRSTKTITSIHEFPPEILSSILQTVIEMSHETDCILQNVFSINQTCKLWHTIVMSNLHGFYNQLPSGSLDNPFAALENRDIIHIGIGEIVKFLDTTWSEGERTSFRQLIQKVIEPKRGANIKDTSCGRDVRISCVSACLWLPAISSLEALTHLKVSS